MCPCISENVTAYQRAMCVSTDMWEQCECVRWLSPLHSESRSLKPHQRVCGRQNDKARNQPASACSHTQIHADAHTFILTHKSITLSHLDTRCLLHWLSGSLFPLAHTHTFNTSRHYTTSPIQWSLFRPRMQSAAEADVCVCILSLRQTLTKQRGKIGLLLWIYFSILT